MVWKSYITHYNINSFSASDEPKDEADRIHICQLQDTQKLFICHQVTKYNNMESYPEVKGGWFEECQEKYPKIFLLRCPKMLHESTKGREVVSAYDILLSDGLELNSVIVFCQYNEIAGEARPCGYIEDLDPEMLKSVQENPHDYGIKLDYVPYPVDIFVL